MTDEQARPSDAPREPSPDLGADEVAEGLAGDLALDDGPSLSEGAAESGSLQPGALLEEPNHVPGPERGHPNAGVRVRR